jgi:hypothetical protein
MGKFKIVDGKMLRASAKPTAAQQQQRWRDNRMNIDLLRLKKQLRKERRLRARTTCWNNWMRKQVAG